MKRTVQKKKKIRKNWAKSLFIHTQNLSKNIQFDTFLKSCIVHYIIIIAYSFKKNKSHEKMNHTIILPYADKNTNDFMAGEYKLNLLRT